MKSPPIRFANPIATIVTAETQDKNGERIKWHKTAVIQADDSYVIQSLKHY